MKQENEIKNDESIWQIMFDQFFNSEKIILKTLAACNVSFSKYEGIEEYYTVDESRSGVIIKTRNPETDKIERTIIDITNGEHTNFQQLLDVTFNMGKNCKNRILVINGEKVDAYPQAYDEILDDFICYMNKFGQNIYQVQADLHFIIELSELKLLSELPEKCEYNASDLPDQERFQNAEFWQLYFYPNTIFYPTYESEKVGDYLFEKGFMTETGLMDIILRWDDKGVSFRAIETSKGRDFKIIIENNLERIRNKHYGLEISIIKNDDTLSELILIFDDRPIQNFYYLSLEQKMDLSTSIREGFFDFLGFISDLEYENQKKVKC